MGFTTVFKNGILWKDCLTCTLSFCNLFSSSCNDLVCHFDLTISAIAAASDFEDLAGRSIMRNSRLGRNVYLGRNAKSVVLVTAPCDIRQYRRSGAIARC